MALKRTIFSTSRKLVQVTTDIVLSTLKGLCPTLWNGMIGWDGKSQPSPSTRNRLVSQSFSTRSDRPGLGVTLLDSSRIKRRKNVPLVWQWHILLAPVARCMPGLHLSRVHYLVRKSEGLADQVYSRKYRRVGAILVRRGGRCNKCRRYYIHSEQGRPGTARGRLFSLITVSGDIHPAENAWALQRDTFHQCLDESQHPRHYILCECG